MERDKKALKKRALLFYFVRFIRDYSNLFRSFNRAKIKLLFKQQEKSEDRARIRSEDYSLV